MAETSSGKVELQVQDAVALLEISNPERRNAMTQAMWEQLSECVRQVADAPGIRLVQLRGEGDTFCAGADISEFMEIAADAKRLESNQHAVEQAQIALERLPVPTLAVVEGACFGGGLGIALACDFRIAASDSRFAITPARLGLAYSLADTRRLHRTVGAPLCREMLLMARELSAAQAERHRLVNLAVDARRLDDEVARWSDRITSLSGVSQRAIKRTLNAIEGAGEDDADSLHALMREAFAGADLAEGVAAFTQKRRAEFD